MEVVSDKPVSICDQYSFFSLLNTTSCAKGITITRAKYPLVDAEISCEYQYGVSNEVLPGETATVSVKYGKLLLIKIQNEKVKKLMNPTSVQVGQKWDWTSMQFAGK